MIIDQKVLKNFLNFDECFALCRALIVSHISETCSIITSSLERKEHVPFLKINALTVFCYIFSKKIL